MSETDSFLREVSEEVRQEELARIWARHRWAILGGIAAVIAGVAGWTWVEHSRTQAALAAGAALIAAEGADAAAQAALADSLADGPGLVAGFRAAAALAETDPDTAMARYRGLAALPDLEPAYADLATLSALRIAATRSPVAEVLAGLAPLTAPERPYRLLALELQAMMRMNSGDVAGAIADLDAVLADPAATAATLARARAVRATVAAAE